MTLVEDPLYRPFIVGYLMAALDERFWPLLVEVALEHGDQLNELRASSIARATELQQERYW